MEATATPRDVHTNGRATDEVLARLRTAPSVVTGPALSGRLHIANMLDTPVEPIPYRVDKFAADGHVTVLASKGGEGKSALALALAIGVTAGGSPGGLQCTKGKALIIDAEQGYGEIKRRYQHAQGPRTGIAYYDVGDGSCQIVRDEQLIINTIKYEDANFVVFDSLRALAPEMDENDSGSTAPVMCALQRIAKTTEAAIVVLHHTNKSGGFRGSTAIRDCADALFIFGRYSEDPKGRTRRYLSCGADGKMRFDAEPDCRWMDVSAADGIFTVTAADAYHGQQSASVARGLAEVIIEKLPEKPLKLSEIAETLDRKPTDKTVRRALELLETAGQVEKLKDKTYRFVPDDNS